MNSISAQGEWLHRSRPHHRCHEKEGLPLVFFLTLTLAIHFLTLSVTVTKDGPVGIASGFAMGFGFSYMLDYVRDLPISK